MLDNPKFLDRFQYPHNCIATVIYDKVILLIFPRKV